MFLLCCGIIGGLVGLGVSDKLGFAGALGIGLVSTVSRGAIDAALPCSAACLLK